MIHAQSPHFKADPRRLLTDLFVGSVKSLRGDALVRQNSRLEADRWVYDGLRGPIEWDLPPGGRIFVVGAGKAVAALAKGIEEQFGDRIDDGCIVVKYGHTETLRRIRQVEAGHPVPDENGVAGTQELLATLEGLTAKDRVFVLITGGASALMIAPAKGISLADKAAVTAMLLRSHASIEEINTVRQSLSEVKGGRLLDRLVPARSMTLLISDIPSGDLTKIGSGPTMAEAPGIASPLEILAGHGIAGKLPDSVIRHLSAEAERPPPIAAAGRAETILLADSASLVCAIEQAANELDLRVRRVDTAMQGNTHASALAFAAAMKDYRTSGGRAPCLFVSAGETTLEIKGQGLGGRNQEFALVAAQALAGIEGCLVLAAGTDGTDGPTPAAGGFADGTTLDRATRLGLSVERTLADNDSYHLLQALDDLLVTGPTGTNVMDLVLGLVF